MNRRQVLGTACWLLPLSAMAQSRVAPQPDLAAVQGHWRGTLTYRDYTRPDRLVTLPTQLYAALAAPDALTLHYVYDDGPSKTVYGYEQMAFDWSNAVLNWRSGFPEPMTRPHRITSSQAQDGGRQIRFEREDGDGLSRFVMSLHPTAFSLAKEDGPAPDALQFRNRYEFTRGTGVPAAPAR